MEQEVNQLHSKLRRPILACIVPPWDSMLVHWSSREIGGLPGKYNAYFTWLILLRAATGVGGKGQIWMPKFELQSRWYKSSF